MCPIPIRPRRCRMAGFVAVCLASLCMGQTASAGLVVNGSFEQPGVAPGTFIDISPGQEAGVGFTGWTVGRGNVDVVNATAPIFGINWGAQATITGSQLLDLNGFTEGSIYQNLTTVAGQVYTLSFWYANNPVGNNPPYPHTADVFVADIGTTNNPLGMTSIAHNTSTLTSPNWQFRSLNFVAQGSTTRLTFASTSNPGDPSGGVVLDAVDVNAAPAAAPEPSSVVLLGLGGLGVIGWFRRRKCVEV
jgi:hypothetical protein